MIFPYLVTVCCPYDALQHFHNKTLASGVEDFIIYFFSIHTQKNAKISYFFICIIK